MKWYEDKAFIMTLVNAIILIAGMLRGVPVAPSVERRLDRAGDQAAAAAGSSAENNKELKHIRTRGLE
jgi:hypothetical protein